MLEENWERRFHAQIEWDAMFDTRAWCGKIPYLKFPADVEVKVIPPFSGAVVRFLIRKGNKSVSCYLDCYGILGAMNQPYWEIYPFEGDTYRCYIDETDELMEKIVEELNREESEEVSWE